MAEERNNSVPTIIMFLLSIICLTQLSGFGVTETGNLAKVLLTAELPYINFTDCKRRVGEDFKDSISFDKFCAGNETGNEQLSKTPYDKNRCILCVLWFVNEACGSGKSSPR